MGNVLSNAPTRTHNTDNIASESETITDMGDQLKQDSNEAPDESINRDEARIKAKEKDMEEFKKQLEIKREQRKEILTRHRVEKEALEKSLQDERLSKLELYETNKQLRELLVKNSIEIPEDLLASRENTELTDAIVQIREEFEKMKENNNKLRKDLVESNSALQNAYSDIAELSLQNTQSMKQIHTLKEVITVSKTLISLREDQLNELKNKLNDIERTLSDRETNLLSTDLKQEYERQLQNIRTLRGLYEERARLAEVTRQSLARELEEQKILNQAEMNKSKKLSERVEELEANVETLHEIIENKNNQINTCQDEKNVLKAEMSVVNKLFSQVLLGYQTKQDLDTLVHRLEEHHGILTHMAERENDSEASSALPKLLLELVSEVDENEKNNNTHEDNENQINADSINESKFLPELQNNSITNTTPEEIVKNLPKVWKVLTELLSHQTIPENNPADNVTTCYKSVETTSGIVLVPSVSQTYIRLKNLIIEKLGLIKEVNRMKLLNTHLESRLDEQEKRLCLVTSELSKTWHVVGRLRRHHHQLHTHEKILKYELQQKRKLLNELKEELEYCREKWEQAREKHTQSEKDWKKLRAEFSNRKAKLASPSFNNSAESGYSDERPSDESSESNDESGYVQEPLIRCKKKLRKSFETILDTSTDYNQAAEREDPASDMLDVADLPLDTQNGDDNQEVSDLSKSEHLSLFDKVCEETEDEIGDIAHDDSCSEDVNTEINELSKNSVFQENVCVEIDNNSHVNNGTGEGNSSILSDEQNINNINPAEVLTNIKLQNEKLLKKDERLENLEKNSTNLLRKTQDTVKSADQINNILENLRNRPTSSYHEESNDKTIKDTNNMDTILEVTSVINDNQVKTIDCNIKDREISELGRESNENFLLAHTKANYSDNETTTLDLKTEIKCDVHTADMEKKTVSENDSISVNNADISVDFKSILENVRLQDVRLALKDKRLETLEAGCSEVVNNIANTLKSGEQIIEKLDNLHEKYVIAEDGMVSEDSLNKEINQNCKMDELPSTSNEIDHEARFAARELRLKRLEEQTKSLVNKVNKTTTKGVKINYKLEELHNIYGSENSRAGTPSEDSNDKSNDDEPRSE